MIFTFSPCICIISYATNWLNKMPYPYTLLGFLVHRLRPRYARDLHKEREAIPIYKKASKTHHHRSCCSSLILAHVDTTWISQSGFSNVDAWESRNLIAPYPNQFLTNKEVHLCNHLVVVLFLPFPFPFPFPYGLRSEGQCA